MKRGVIVCLVGVKVGQLLRYSPLFLRASEIVPGATSYKLIGGCELIHYDEKLQPFPTLVLACSRMDMIRLGPLPLQQPWDEDWWGGSSRLFTTI